MTTPTRLADLPHSEKKKLIARLLREEEEQKRQAAIRKGQLFAELFPESRIGPMANSEELLEVLGEVADVTHEGLLPNVKGIFAELGERTGRVERWAKVNAGATIPSQLKALLPQLAHKEAIKEVTIGGMMTDTDQSLLCRTSPANFGRVLARSLGRVRQTKALAKLVVEHEERMQELESQVLALQVHTGSPDAWLTQAVKLHKSGANWGVIVAAVGKRRSVVIAQVKRAMAAEEIA